MNIIPLTESLLPSILLIEREQAFPWSLERFQNCFSPGYDNWLIIQDEMVVGFGIMKIGIDEAEILNIAIKKEYRRRSLGQQLLQHLLNRAKILGAKRIFLEVRKSNLAAVLMYKKIGFIYIKERKDYYPAEEGREDALIFSLVL